MESMIKECTERNAAIYCMLQVANEAMRKNEVILNKLKERVEISKQLLNE